MARAASKKQPTIVVVAQPAKTFRANSARALWWDAVQEFHGKPVEAFVAHVSANPPSQPKKGKLAGKTEPVTGWLSYFANAKQHDGTALINIQ